MKKFLSIMSLTIGLLMSTTAFVACGSSDDDSTGGSGSDMQPSKRITKIIEEDGDYLYERTLSYDSQGRVTKIVETKSGVNTNGLKETTYQYGETLILSKMVEEGYNSSNTFSRSQSHTLENGRIVKDVDIQTTNNKAEITTTREFSYDSNNYLSSESHTTTGSASGGGTKMFTWSDGNVIKVGNHSFEYSNYSRAKGIPLYLDSSNTDEYLFAMGYYGNIPKNLQSKTYYSSESGSTYDYTFEGSYVSKIVITPFVETSKAHKRTMTFIWE